jgi:hypothetical protein
MSDPHFSQKPAFLSKNPPNGTTFLRKRLAFPASPHLDLHLVRKPCCPGSGKLAGP